MDSSPLNDASLGARIRADGLVQLDRDHPGFRDSVYRAQRNRIAAQAFAWQGGDPPVIEYTAEEHGVWRQVMHALKPLHEQHVCSVLVEAGQQLDLFTEAIPQFTDLNPVLQSATGFGLAPVAGLVAPEHFLSQLADGVFLATQYVRHPSAPLYTPEPDTIHELTGHAASLMNPTIAQVNRSFGHAARVGGCQEIAILERVYWHTMEFGAVQEEGQVKAFGAGLLSSCGELQSFRERADLRPFDLQEIAATPYDPTEYQPVVFVAESFEVMMNSLEQWLRQSIKKAA